MNWRRVVAHRLTVLRRQGRKEAGYLGSDLLRRAMQLRLLACVSPEVASRIENAMRISHGRLPDELHDLLSSQDFL